MEPFDFADVGVEAGLGLALFERTDPDQAFQAPLVVERAPALGVLSSVPPQQRRSGEGARFVAVERLGLLRGRQPVTHTHSASVAEKSLDAAGIEDLPAAHYVGAKLDLVFVAKRLDLVLVEILYAFRLFAGVILRVGQAL